jgi:hypothetical protein
MKMKFFGWGFFAAISMMLTGCSSIQNYSIRSYQGPLPMEDYRSINPVAYGIPVATR